VTAKGVNLTSDEFLHRGWGRPRPRYRGSCLGGARVRHEYGVVPPCDGRDGNYTRDVQLAWYSTRTPRVDALPGRGVHERELMATAKKKPAAKKAGAKKKTAARKPAAKKR